VLIILVGFPYVLPTFEANPFGAPFAGRSDVGGDTNLLKGVRLTI